MELSLEVGVWGEEDRAGGDRERTPTQIKKCHPLISASLEKEGKEKREAKTKSGPPHGCVRGLPLRWRRVSVTPFTPSSRWALRSAG